MEEEVGVILLAGLPLFKLLRTNGKIQINTISGVRTLSTGETGNAEGLYFVGEDLTSNTYYFDCGHLENSQAGAYQWFSNILTETEMRDFGIKNNCEDVTSTRSSNPTVLASRLSRLQQNENLSDFVILAKKTLPNGRIVAHYIRPVEIRDGCIYVQDSDQSPGGKIIRLEGYNRGYFLKKLVDKPDVEPQGLP